MFTMRMLQLAVVVGLLAIVMSGCGPYHNYPPYNLVGVKKPERGFSDLQLDARTFSVEYQANQNFSDKIDLFKQRLLWRCAQLVQGSGYRYFTVLYGHSFATTSKESLIQEIAPGIYWMMHRATKVVGAGVEPLMSYETVAIGVSELRTIVRGIQKPEQGGSGMTYDIADFVPYARE